LQPPAAIGDDLPEIPSRLHDEIASWRSVIHNTSAEDARDQLRRAALELFRVLLIVKTEAPASHAVAHQVTVDALHEFADFHDVDADHAQLIFAEAKKAAVAVPAPAAPAPAAKQSPNWRDHVVAAQDLCDQRFPEVKFLVPGLFPEGVTLLVSRPKLGKSWLLLQIGSSIAGGVSALVATDEPARGDVLYLSLEDNKRRVQRRMTKHFGGCRECWPRPLEIVTTWRRLDQGGLQDLREWCASVAKPTLIMVDTLKKVRPPKRHGQTDYDADYEACEGLIALAHEFPGLALIVAHHDRKMAADDVFDTVSGTLGLTGGVDTIAIFKRSGQGTTLHIQGRDLVEDVEKAVRFDRETCRWTILGEAAEVHRSGERARVLEAVRGVQGEGLGVSEIMAAAGICSRAAADALLYRMSKAGEITRRGRGRYVLPSTPASEPSESEKANKTAETQGETGAPNASDASDARVKAPLAETPGPASRRA
jgi:hypothetical protein